MKEKKILIQLLDFESKNVVEHSESRRYILIKIDIDILDYIMFSATYKNIHLENHKLYREYEYDNRLDDLKYSLINSNLEKEHRSYKNIDKLDKLMSLENDLNTKVIREVSNLLEEYDLLDFIIEYRPNQDNQKYSNLRDLNQSVNIAKNHFSMKLIIHSKDKKYSEEYILKVECN